MTEWVRRSYDISRVVSEFGTSLASAYSFPCPLSMAAFKWDTRLCLTRPKLHSESFAKSWRPFL